MPSGTLARDIAVSLGIDVYRLKYGATTYTALLFCFPLFPICFGKILRALGKETLDFDFICFCTLEQNITVQQEACGRLPYIFLFFEEVG